MDSREEYMPSCSFHMKADQPTLVKQGMSRKDQYLSIGNYRRPSRWENPHLRLLFLLPDYQIHPPICLSAQRTRNHTISTMASSGISESTKGHCFPRNLDFTAPAGRGIIQAGCEAVQYLQSRCPPGLQTLGLLSLGHTCKPVHRVRRPSIRRGWRGRDGIKLQQRA